MRLMTLSFVILACLATVVVGQDPLAVPEVNEMPTDSGFPDEGDLRLLFIHHSCGGQLLAEPGEKVGGGKGSGERCIYESHYNGGGLRKMLDAAGYEVHEASYESIVGEDTDIHHWRLKFTEMMDRILVTDRQDAVYPDGRTNHIVVFKSCYPNNDYVGVGFGGGDPDSPERTIVNSRAAYASLLPLFAEHPEVLFLALTPPPRAEPPAPGLLARFKSRFARGPEPADWAREFNAWLADHERGWLADYEAPNVAVFDYYDELTDSGRSNWSAYATKDGTDSHPSDEGNARAAEAFLSTLADAVAAMRTTP